ncbi:DUF1961 family protein [Cyclobacterium qasimii]|uniref:DUF1961 family protein n=2 Tax=Cyclobacterium qasimii TaxID=1350429 RepID=S7WMT9_9BACT|nr:DUF1961 family protein [Cyclobacterium qasimii]EPR65513.1 hypothetical protein ADICYQ_5434 [Cyclobacterium qasimii M12-11B]GEO19625.1 hypothetical protein CQA01_01590 [Cyclobacterium qasimii]
MKNTQSYLLIFVLTLFILGCNNKNSQETPWEKSTLLFEDSGTENWQQKWMLDGLQSKVINSKEGMELIAGPEHGNDSSHTVLWTKQTFEGNISIEYDYTRTDTTTRCVNILYFHGEGKGDADYPSDISLWNDKRKVPSMRTYFDNMNTYHISYAAFGANEYSGENDYIRLRRYNPNKDGLKGTDVPDDYFNTGLFKPDVTYHIEVIKYNNFIEMHIQNKNDSSDYLICKWDASLFPLNDSGRIGLRHMYTRAARYKNFKVWKLN